MEADKEAYTKAFVSKFGAIDPKQDWNMAMRGSVTVTTSSATEVKVYAPSDDEYRLVGDFGNVIGTETLEFDIRRGVTDLIVSANGKSIQTTVGQAVSFNTQALRSKSNHNGDEDDPWGIYVEYAEGDDEYKYFTDNNEASHTGVYEYALTLPENERNVDKATDDFKLTTGDAGHEFILYPVYWNTDKVDEIGIAYYDGAYYYEVPIYTIKSGGELAASVDGDTYVNVEKNDDNSDVNVSSDFKISGTKATKFRSKGIKVKVDGQNREFVFYIKQSGGNTVYYSSRERNKEVDKYDGASGEKELPAHVATYMADGGWGRWLCFEDGQDNTANEPDLNDVVFYTNLSTVDNPDINIIGEKPLSWILAAEDMGSLDDFDFNDMVVEVTTPTLKSRSTSEYVVKVKALAAGGTLWVKLLRGKETLKPNNGNGDVKFDYFHSWFGDNGNVSAETMINTYQADTYKSQICTITLKEEDARKFTLSSSVNSSDVKNMGGFTFIVERVRGEEIREIEAPGSGTAPQMICVPGTWKWPKERKSIKDAYPDFSKWVADYDSNIKWYENYDSNLVVDR